eukprot:s872_g12.t1
MNLAMRAADGNGESFEPELRDSVADTVLVRASAGPCGKLTLDAAEKEASGLSSHAGLGDRATGLTREKWLVRLSSCKNLSEIGMTLAWGLNAGFLCLERNLARPSQPAGVKTRLRGLFPLPVLIPEVIRNGGCPIVFDRGSPGFSKVATECWLAVVCSALNAFYGCNSTPPGARALEKSMGLCVRACFLGLKDSFMGTVSLVWSLKKLFQR